MVGKIAANTKIDEIEFLEQAYDWYKDYLIWEDKNINEDINSKLN